MGRTQVIVGAEMRDWLISQQVWRKASTSSATRPTATANTISTWLATSSSPVSTACARSLSRAETFGSGRLAERDDFNLNLGDYQISIVLIHRAGWQEASMGWQSLIRWIFASVRWPRF